jgi:lysophospholipase L1-like esterase
MTPTLSSDEATLLSSLQLSSPIKTAVASFDSETSNKIHSVSNLTFESRVAQNPGALVGVSLGDSWFDYLPAFFSDLSGDLMAHLHSTGRFNIYNFGQAGDTLENMAYGTTVQSGFQPVPCKLIEVVAAVKKYQPAFFLLSGGGNDFSGNDGICLEAYLNHSSSGFKPLRMDRAEETFDVFDRAMIESICKAVHDAAPEAQVFIHGYDYAMPDGRPVFQVPLGFHFIGPWLMPAFARKRLMDLNLRFQTIRDVIDLYNKTLASIAGQYPYVHHIDCRGVLQQNTADWANELHPTPAGWAKIANKFEQSIFSVLRPALAPA